MEPSNELNPFGIQAQPQSSGEDKADENSNEQQTQAVEPQASSQSEEPSVNVLNEKKEVDVFEILSISWKKFKENWKFLVVLSLIYVGIRFIEGILEKSVQKGSPESFGVSLLVAVFNVFIAIGMVRIFLNISRGGQSHFKEIFGGMKYFWKFVGASIIYLLIVLVGYLLLIIPGIIWQYKYGLFSYLIVDKDMKPMEAIRESGRLMQGNKWKLFFLQLLMIAVIIIGALLLGVGMLVAIPVVTLMSVYFYRIVSGETVSA